MNITTYTRAVLVTGQDDRGNEYAYWKKVGGSWDEWLDGYSAVEVSASYIAHEVVPNVTHVRFGNETMTRDEWIASGCPFNLSREEVEALHKLHTAERNTQS